MLWPVKGVLHQLSAFVFAAASHQTSSSRKFLDSTLQLKHGAESARSLQRQLTILVEIKGTVVLFTPAVLLFSAASHAQPPFPLKRVRFGLIRYK
jgi:hypothetical protein